MRITGIETSKSYATEKNLLKALEQFPQDWRYVVVRKEDGRYTAIFQGNSLGPDIAGAARMGFLTI